MSNRYLTRARAISFWHAIPISGFMTCTAKTYAITILRLWYGMHPSSNNPQVLPLLFGRTATKYRLQPQAKPLELATTHARPWHHTYTKHLVWRTRDCYAMKRINPSWLVVNQGQARRKRSRSCCEILPMCKRELGTVRRRKHRQETTSPSIAC